MRRGNPPPALWQWAPRAMACESPETGRRSADPVPLRQWRGECASPSHLAHHSSRGAEGDASDRVTWACAAYVCPSSGGEGLDGGGDCGAGRGLQADARTAPTTHTEATCGATDKLKRSVCGRPGTCGTWRALTKATSKPRAARIGKSGLQYTPVDSLTPVVIRQAVRQSARRGTSQGNALHFWTGWASRSAGTPPRLFSPHIDACGMRMEDGHMLGEGVFFLPFVARRSSRQAKRGRGREDRDPTEQGDNRGRRAASGETVSS